MRRVKACGAGMLLGLFAGTASAGVGDFFGGIVDGAGEIVGSAVDGAGSMLGLTDLVDDLDKPYIEHLTEGDQSNAGTDSDEDLKAGRQADVLKMRHANMNLVEISGLEAYGNQVLAKLNAAWPGAPVHAEMRITASNDFGGVSLEHGTIFIPLGTLLKLESEDELAALLGHELSHVILGHHDKDVSDEFMDKAFNYGELALRMQGGENGQLLRNYAKLKVAQWATSHALMPKWNRGQETEADVLGIDLMMRAGYNGDGMKELLQKIEATSQARQELVANATGFDNPASANQPATLKIDVGAMLTDLTTSLENEFSQEHEDAKKRRDDLRTYLRKHYSDRPRLVMQKKSYVRQLAKRKIASRMAAYRGVFKAMDRLSAAGDKVPARDLKTASIKIKNAIHRGNKNDPFLWMRLYEVRHLQGQQASAIDNVGMALKSGQAPYISYNLLALSAYQKHDYKQTVHYIDQVKEVFGDDEDLIDLRILAEKQQGKRAEEHMLRCLATARIELIERCNAASRGNHQLSAGHRPG